MLYLYIIMHCQVANGMRVSMSASTELGQYRTEIVVAQLVHDGAQQRAVLEASVHALSEKRYHRMGCVAQQQCIVVQVIGIALQYGGPPIINGYFL